MKKLADKIKVDGNYIFVGYSMFELETTNFIEVKNHAGIVDSFADETIFEVEKGTQIIIRNGAGNIEDIFEYDGKNWVQ